MSLTAYTPGIGNLPFGNLNTNPQSSNYNTDSGYSADESILIQKAVQREIFDAAPKQYNALKLLYAKEMKDVNLDEFEFLEHTFGREPVTANAISAAVAAVAGTTVTQSVTVTAATVTFLTPDLILIYPNNSKGVITAIAGNVLTVKSLTSSGLPAVAVNDVFAIQSTIVADGMDYFSNYERVSTVTRYNYVQFFLRACRWNRVELQKHKNAGTTNYLDIDRAHKLKQIRIDLFNSFFNGTRGEFQISNLYVAKAMGGIFPTMVAAGSQNANPTTAGFAAAFEALAFSTNFKAEGDVRFVYGTDEILHLFSQTYKLPTIEYRPENQIADLRLQEIRIGTMRFVLVPCELFKETACFPSIWQRRMLILDQETIHPVKMKGLPALEMGGTLDLKENGTREDFKDWWVRAQLSIQFNNPLGSFYIDVQ